MDKIRFDHRVGGLALLVGYCLLFAVLFRNPGEGVTTATATVQGLLFVVVLPVLGLCSGVYLYLDKPFRMAVAAVGSSYLGVVGVGLAFLSTTNPVVTPLGLLFVGLATLALVAALRSSVDALVPDQQLD
jgi:hypothetical protein